MKDQDASWRDEAVRHGFAAQRRASDPSLSAWVSAHAGSGKTHVLTFRMLRLLLTGAAPERILCLTYTRAAAAEMANRTIEALSAWTFMEETHLDAKLKELTGVEPDDALRRRARSAYAHALSVPGGLRIHTIHGFCERLLRRFSIEAGVPSNFIVLDDMQRQEIIRNVLHGLPAQAGDPQADPDGKLGKAVKRLAGILSDGGGAYDRRNFTTLVGEAMASRHRLFDWLTEHRSLSSDLFASLATCLDIDENEDETSFYRSQIDRFDRKTAMAAVTALKASGKTNDEKASLQLQKALDESDPEYFFAAYRLLFHTKDGKPRRKIATQGVAAEARDFLEKEKERVVEARRRLARLTIARDTEAFVHLAVHVHLGALEAKRRRAALDFDDLIHRATQLIETSEHARWALYAVDQGIDHLLIDEVQDTGARQWPILRALAEIFFTESPEEKNARTFFAVGDEKQSIYSFQGASLPALREEKNKIKAMAEDHRRPWAEPSLALSFRSTSAILDAVDGTFGKGAALWEDRQAWLDHIPCRRDHPGEAQLWPLFVPEDDGEENEKDDDPWTPPNLPDHRETGAMRAAAAIADEIARLIADETVIDKTSGEARPIAAGDIMILTRRRDPRFLEALQSSLQRRGVAAMGLDRMRLCDALAVGDALAAANVALLPQDDMTLAASLKSPLLGLTEDDLMQLAAPQREGSLWRRFCETAESDGDSAFIARLRFAHRRLRGWMRTVDHVPPFEFFMHLLETEGGRARLLRRLGASASDPLDELLLQSLAYERNHTAGMYGFIDWLTRHDLEIKRDMDQGDDAVRILTVHAAKGLEAPIVFLPDTTASPWNARHIPTLLWPTDGKNDPPLCHLGSDRALDALQDRIDPLEQEAGFEHRRLLYVAMTRARDRLYILGYAGKKKKNDEKEKADAAEKNEKTGEKKSWYDIVEASGAVEKRSPPQPRLPRREPPVPALQSRASAAATPAWLARPLPKEPMTAPPLHPSRPDDRDSDDGETDRDSPLRRFRDKAAMRGRLIHRLIERTADLHPDRRDEAARRLLDAHHPPLGKGDAESILSSLRRLFADSDIAPFFGADSRAETALAGFLPARPGEAPIAFSGRVDRLVIENDNVHALEIKSSQHPPSDVTKTPPRHLRQAAGYRAALRALFPDKTIRCSLLWSEAPRLDDLPDSLLDPFSP